MRLPLAIGGIILYLSTRGMGRLRRLDDDLLKCCSLRPTELIFGGEGNWVIKMTYRSDHPITFIIEIAGEL